MSRYDSKTHDEVASRKSDAAQRRTKSADQGPASPKAIAALYRKGKESPSMGDKTDKSYNQGRAEVDRHGPGYNPETSGWVRSKGEDSMTDRPGGFDRLGSKNAHSTLSPTKGGRCEATGQDVDRSPLSAARKTYGPPPTLDPKDWG